VLAGVLDGLQAAEVASAADASAAPASADDHGRIVLNFGALPFVVLCVAPPGA
jgi:hypothetical protein